MSEPTRPRTRGPAERRQRSFRVQTVTQLEERKLLTPYLTIAPPVATFTPVATQPPNTTTGTVTVTLNPVAATTTGTTAGFLSAAPLVSVTELTPITSFGGDIVRIRSGPGGSFGNDVYAISRGAGANTGAINRPGVIYRVDPATGKSSVFFDLNSLVNQLSPGDTAANSVGTSTGLVNWYDMTFDPNGIFDGIPSMFVSSVDRSDPAKNAIYQIGANGQLISIFSQFTAGQSALKFTANPSAILVPPAEQQSFLNGLIAGSGSGASSLGVANFAALFFNANQFRPGTPISSATLPFGVSQTGLVLGPQTSLTSANILYGDTVYDTFTDFGTPAGGGIPAQPGVSGVEGLGGELLINNGVFPTTPTTAIDTYPALSTDFRRMQDSAFDYYGYFSYGMTIGTAAATTGGGASAGGGTTGTGTTTVAIGAPTFVGSLFVTDLGTGLAVSIANPNAPPGNANSIVPVQGPGGATVTNPVGGLTPAISAPTGNIGGRIVRISPTGVVTDFAQGFDTVGASDSSSFVNSSLSITFSADGTALYASDNDAIWQFKSVADLASSTSGSLIGLNDLRTFGVPYDGQGTAVAVVDSGVDARNPNFRGRVTVGTNLVTGGPGNDDLAGASNITSTTTGGGGGGAGGTGGGTGGTGATQTVTAITQFGHGTLVAGIIAQFVPQATIEPVNIFNPFVSEIGTTGGTTGTGVGISAATNAVTTTQNLYDGLNYVATHPYVADPVRPGQFARVTTTALGFGTTESFDSEGSAYRRYPQIVIALKNQMDLLRRRGIQPIAAAGQFGTPFGSGAATTGATGGAGGAGGIGGAGGAGGAGTGGVGGIGGLGQSGTNSAQNPNVGDTAGMSLPAILNEVVSVTGVIPFPYETGPSQIPTKPAQGVFPRPIGPVLLFGSTLTIGAIGGTTTGAGAGTNTGTGATFNNLAQITSGNNPSPGVFTLSGTGTGGNGTGAGTTNVGGSLFYSDAILAAANRGVTTDYAAPALDTPTFASTFSGNANMDNNFTTAGTSMSAAIVTGAFDMISSALQYWNTINRSGVTSDAYLTTPVGVHTLNFGAHPFKNLLGYNNPDGINSILQWTSTPVVDANNGLTQSTPQLIPGTTSSPSYSRIDVGNAVAAIEGSIAINYLLKHNDFNLIDANHDGLITAQELQNFTDNAAAMGVPEAGAMARLLGGTARIPTTSTASDQFLSLNFLGPYGATFPLGEQPDQPDALQRRYNFFDYNADGSLNGAISINQFKMLAHTLLPSPTSFVVVDRQRASTSGYLDNPNVPRNYVALQHIQPTYQFVSKFKISKYTNISPDRFGVNRNTTPSTLSFPVYELFDGKGTTNVTASSSSNIGTGTGTGTGNGSSTTGSGSAASSAVGSGTGSATAATGSTKASTAASGTTTAAATSPTTPASSTASTSPSTSSSGSASQGASSSATTTTPLNQAFGSTLGKLLTDLNVAPQTAGATSTTPSTSPASTAGQSTPSTGTSTTTKKTTS